MIQASVKSIDRDLVPVIDISALCDGSDPASVARELHGASQSSGFIYVKGHGIPDAVINDARATARRFFRSGTEEKQSVRVSDKHRGWLGHGAARMQDDVLPDLKESYIWGFQDEAGTTPEDHALRGANRWPSFLPVMESHAMAFFEQAHLVAHHLMRGFALGLGLSRDFFLQTAARPLSRASFVYYPPQDDERKSGQFGVGPHTDFGVLTVLCQDEVGGLQVCDANGDWVAAPPIAGTLVVNVGDLLARWTDGAYRSTPHRVVNTSGRERLSLVLAFDPDPDTVIDARQIFGPDHQALHPPITCGDYLIWRFAKAFAYRAG